MIRLFGFLLSFALIQAAQASVTFSSISNELDLPIQCKEFLKGRSLKSNLIEKDSVQLKDFNSAIDSKRLPINGYDFYNYSNANYTSMVTSNNFLPLFKFLKKKPLKHCCGNTFKAGLYIAEDPTSSKRFGRNQLKLILSENAKVILLDKGYYFTTDVKWSDVFKEIENSHPGFSNACSPKDVRAIILENSGIDIVSYKSTITSRDGKQKAWFILLNSKSIESASFIKDAK